MKRQGMKTAALAIGSAVLFSVSVSGETLDITIKGFDDGTKTSRQQDYKEAVLDAKRQAIEQAGVTVESKSTVRNSVLQEDFIESHAKAVLLPGFQIMDIGYMQDGTYQVVLTGRVQVQPKAADQLADSGVLALVMDLYSIPISFQLDGKLLDANQPFLAIGAVMDSQTVKTYTSLRDLKKQHNNLLHYFVYLFRLPAGRHSLNIKASVLLGRERQEHGNQVDVEVIPKTYVVYEYLAHPHYSFELADREFLLERLALKNRYRDTTAVFRQRVAQRLGTMIGEFGGCQF